MRPHRARRPGLALLALSTALVLVTAGAASGIDPDDPRVTPVVKAYLAARPAVVNISARRVTTARRGLFGGFGDDPFEHFLPSPLRRRVAVRSLGSGVVIHSDGYVVTNAHVVARAQEITVTMSDGQKHPARQISADPSHDLAVLKVDPPEGKAMERLRLGRSDDLLVGETTIAVGNPLGLANSVTTGVVSATDRKLELSGDLTYEGLIQTDAPINPGNSGGPLLNIKGELIGINTAIRADAQNIGFAVPIDALAAQLPELLDFERINRIVFGATVRQRRDEQGDDELIVSVVREGTPAAEAGLTAGDRILQLDDRPVSQVPEFVCPMMGLEPDDTVTLVWSREGDRHRAEVTLAARPAPDAAGLAARLLGVRLRPVTPETARELNLAVDAGLVVTEVRRDGPADGLGMRPRDVLFQVGRLFVKDMDDLGMVLEDVEPGDRLRLGVARGSVRVWVTAVAGGEAPRPRDEEPEDTPQGQRI